MSPLLREQRDGVQIDLDPCTRWPHWTLWVSQEPRVLSENTHKCLCAPAGHRRGQDCHWACRRAVETRGTQKDVCGPDAGGPAGLRTSAVETHEWRPTPKTKGRQVPAHICQEAGPPASHRSPWGRAEPYTC